MIITKTLRSYRAWNRLKTVKGFRYYLTKKGKLKGEERTATVAWDLMMSMV